MDNETRLVGDDGGDWVSGLACRSGLDSIPNVASDGIDLRGGQTLPIMPDYHIW